MINDCNGNPTGRRETRRKYEPLRNVTRTASGQSIFRVPGSDDYLIEIVWHNGKKVLVRM